jgi:hypothetical protein
VNHLTFALILLTVSSAAAYARVETSTEQMHLAPIAEVPLIYWDENELLAEQTQVQPPVSVTVPPAPVPAAPAPVTPLPNVTPPAAPAIPIAPVAPETAPDDSADPATPPEENMSEDDFSLGDIPVVETLELTADKARNALNVYVVVRDKYKDAALEDFENLQDFVDQSPQGKAFEADIKAAGFPNVTEWNTTITTLSFAYDNQRDDQTSSIKDQVTELQNDPEIAQDMKDRMIAALNSMIPSENNKKVLEGLLSDPAFKDKLSLLETEGE